MCLLFAYYTCVELVVVGRPGGRKQEYRSLVLRKLFCLFFFWHREGKASWSIKQCLIFACRKEGEQRQKWRSETSVSKSAWDVARAVGNWVADDDDDDATKRGAWDLECIDSECVFLMDIRMTVSVLCVLLQSWLWLSIERSQVLSGRGGARLPIGPGPVPIETRWDEPSLRFFYRTLSLLSSPGPSSIGIPARTKNYLVLVAGGAAGENCPVGSQRNERERVTYAEKRDIGA